MPLGIHLNFFRAGNIARFIGSTFCISSAFAAYTVEVN